MPDRLLEASDYWTSPKVVLKCVGPKLVPFFKTVAIYFVLAISRENPSWFACLLKCLPVAWLCIFVTMHGMSLGEKHAYSRRVLIGLIFSCVGDALLVWPCCFVWGMLSFGIAHVFYTIAFGMHPFNPAAGLVCILVVMTGSLFLYPGLEGPFVLLVPAYTLLLMFMVWRAVSRVQFFEDLWTWTRMCSCAGGILFAVSDTIIGVNKFRFSLPYVQEMIMITYYAAQMGIALSVVDSKAMAVISVAQESSSGNGGMDSCCTPLKRQHLSATLPRNSGASRQGYPKENGVATLKED